jgi:hypothetical protein
MVDNHSPASFDQTAPGFHPRDPPPVDKISSSQPGIGRKTYHLANHGRKGRELLRNDDSTDRNRFRQLYTPSNKLGNSLKVKENRTISVEKNSYESVSKAGK